jgi:hypothetical protein
LRESALVLPWPSGSQKSSATACEPCIEIEKIFLARFAAAETAGMFDAAPCMKPARDGLGLLAGDQRCWSALFPGSGKKF